MGPGPPPPPPPGGGGGGKKGPPGPPPKFITTFPIKKKKKKTKRPSKWASLPQRTSHTRGSKTTALDNLSVKRRQREQRRQMAPKFDGDIFLPQRHGVGFDRPNMPAMKDTHFDPYENETPQSILARFQRQNRSNPSVSRHGTPLDDTGTSRNHYVSQHNISMILEQSVKTFTSTTTSSPFSTTLNENQRMDIPSDATNQQTPQHRYNALANFMDAVTQDTDDTTQAMQHIQNAVTNASDRNRSLSFTQSASKTIGTAPRAFRNANSSINSQVSHGYDMNTQGGQFSRRDLQIRDAILSLSQTGLITIEQALDAITLPMDRYGHPVSSSNSHQMFRDFKQRRPALAPPNSRRNSVVDDDIDLTGDIEQPPSPSPSPPLLVKSSGRLSPPPPLILSRHRPHNTSKNTSSSNAPIDLDDPGTDVDLDLTETANTPPPSSRWNLPGPPLPRPVIPNTNSSIGGGTGGLPSLTSMLPSPAPSPGPHTIDDDATTDEDDDMLGPNHIQGIREEPIRLPSQQRRGTRNWTFPNPWRED